MDSASGETVQLHWARRMVMDSLAIALAVVFMMAPLDARAPT